GFDVEAWADSLRRIRFPLFEFLKPEVMQEAWPLTPADRRHVSKSVQEELGIGMDHRDAESFYAVLSDILRTPGGLEVVERGIEVGGTKASKTRTIRARVAQAINGCGADLWDIDGEEDLEQLKEDDPGLYERISNLVVWHQMAVE